MQQVSDDVKKHISLKNVSLSVVKLVSAPSDYNKHEVVAYPDNQAILDQNTLSNKKEDNARTLDLASESSSKAPYVEMETIDRKIRYLEEQMTDLKRQRIRGLSSASFMGYRLDPEAGKKSFEDFLCILVGCHQERVIETPTQFRTTHVETYTRPQNPPPPYVAQEEETKVY
uniref:EB1 C-terminal domain-containing protein n=1 Tax=Rhabditophanes sp. KR3021 TaxID=114890 RepID=A0AC35TLL5_9BILA